MGTLIALDPSSGKTGIAFFQDGVLQFTRTFTSSGKTPLARRVETAKYVNSLISQYDITVSEEPMLMGRNNEGMQRLLGMLELGNPQIVFIHPLSMKKAITGSGKAEKLDVALAAGEKLKTEAEKEIMANIIQREAFDESDAIGIALTYLEKLN